MSVQVLWAASLLTAAIAADAGVSPRVSKIARSAAAAFHKGDSIRLWHDLAPAAEKLDDQHFASLQQELARRKLPGLGDLLVDIRMKLIQQNLAAALPAPGNRERLLLLEALEVRATKLLSETGQHPIITDPTQPANLGQYESLLWDVHVLHNRLLSAKRAALFAEQIAARFSPRQLKRIDESQRKLVLQLKALGLSSRVAAAQSEMKELEFALRRERLVYGLTTLQKPELTKERFLAAYSTRLDAEILAAHFERLQQTADADGSNQPTLNSWNYQAEVLAQSEQANKLAGDLATKSTQLFHGLHWWLRGRYGKGTEVGGLAKSKAALKNAQLLVWINMPIRPQVPNDPTDKSTPNVPRFERRHHYSWAWEDRKIQTSLLATGKSFRTGQKGKAQ